MVDISIATKGEFCLDLSKVSFNGPLDLLYEMVKAKKIEIRDLFLSDITTQFLNYINDIVALDIDRTSEYMAIAATLMEIKSRELLPTLPITDDMEETPEESIIRQLEQYRLLKEAGLKLKEQENVDRLYKEPSKQADDVRLTAKDMSLDKLLDAFAGILHKLDLNSNASNESKQIVRDNFTVQEKIGFLVDMLTTSDNISFFELFDELVTKNEVIVTFSALLELLKQQYIKARQGEVFGDILIMRNKDFVGEVQVDFQESDVVIEE